MDYTVHGILQAIILEWVVFPFSKGSSQHRDQTLVFCLAGRFFIIIQATREAQFGVVMVLVLSCSLEPVVPGIILEDKSHSSLKE